MIEPSGDKSQPWHVYVTRIGPLSKGRKFYSSVKSKQEAIQMCLERNALAQEHSKIATRKGRDENYEYTYERVH